MASTFTPNKSIERPAAGDYNSTWATPVNNDWTIIDTALGGTTGISVTSVAAGTYALNLAQYQPPNIEFYGTLSGNLVYTIPGGVGGLWSIANSATGAYSITFALASGGNTISVISGQRAYVLSDGSNIEYADTQYANNAAATAQANAETYAATQAGTAQSNAENFSKNGSNISSGTVGAAYLPLIGKLGGVTIAADPGTAPSGVYGDIYFYY
jgi:hypothetical protein